MKKKTFLLTLILCIIFSTLPASASAAMYPEELKGSGYDGRMTVYMYVDTDEGTKAATNVVRFIDMNSSAEYYALFNPMNMKVDRVWDRVLSIPKGEYLISGGRYQDTKAEFYLETNPTVVTIGDGMNNIAVTVAPKEWFDNNEPLDVDAVRQILREDIAAHMGLSVEEAFPEDSQKNEPEEEFDKKEEEFDKKEDEEKLPTVTPVPDKVTPTQGVVIPAEEEEPEEKGFKFPIVAVVVVVLFAVVFIIPKKKKNTSLNDTSEK